MSEGEAGLSKASVVVVSQLFTLDKSELADYIGSLSSKRIEEVIDGIKLVIQPLEPEKI